jgi:hypothetical protein
MPLTPTVTIADRPAGRLPPNPFATRHTRPGVLPALDEHGALLDIAALADRCLALPAAAIEGPHGHGKTTISTRIIEHLGERGLPVVVVRMRSVADGGRAFLAVVRAGRGTLVCIDGWERLGRVAAAAVRLAALCRGLRLLVTAHRATGLPVVMRCTTSEPLLRALVERLPDDGGRISAADIAAAFARHGGNLRESLYDLYDRFERRIR